MVSPVAVRHSPWSYFLSNDINPLAYTPPFESLSFKSLTWSEVLAIYSLALIGLAFSARSDRDHVSYLSLAKDYLAAAEYEAYKKDKAKKARAQRTGKFGPVKKKVLKLYVENG